MDVGIPKKCRVGCTNSIGSGTGRLISSCTLCLLKHVGEMQRDLSSADDKAAPIQPAAG
jgi:hypothetical protein